VRPGNTFKLKYSKWSVDSVQLIYRIIVLYAGFLLHCLDCLQWVLKMLWWFDLKKDIWGFGGEVVSGTCLSPLRLQVQISVRTSQCDLNPVLMWKEWKSQRSAESRGFSPGTPCFLTQGKLTGWVRHIGLRQIINGVWTNSGWSSAIFKLKVYLGLLYVSPVLSIYS
jgi:hypothetical protein